MLVITIGRSISYLIKFYYVKLHYYIILIRLYFVRVALQNHVVCFVLFFYAIFDYMFCYVI